MRVFQIGCPPDEIALLAAKSGDVNDTWLPLWVHSADTLHVMDYLVTDWMPQILQFVGAGDKQSFIRTARILAIMHDLGKASEAFQDQITQHLPIVRHALLHRGLSLKTWEQKPLSHSSIGEILTHIFLERDDIAEIIGAHHGKPWSEGDDILRWEYRELLSSEKCLAIWGGKDHRSHWQSLQKDLMNWMLNQVGETAVTVEQIPLLSESEKVIITGLVIMADWIASNTEYFPLISTSTQENTSISERAQNGIARLRLPPAWKADYFEDPVTLFKSRFGFMPNSVQLGIMNAVGSSENGGIFILEAPMGIGKTEAALMASEMLAHERAGGVFIGLPTQATANGIFTRMVEWGKTQAQNQQLSIRLAHGMAHLNNEFAALMEESKPVLVEQDDQASSGLVVHEWFRGHKQALLADFVIGTVDQVLMAALKQKHFMLRHLGMAGKVIIIDECHAYDAYMNSYLDRALSWLGSYHTPVIMLSATLPSDRRAALVDAYLNGAGFHVEKAGAWRTSNGYPLLTWTDGAQIHQEQIPIELAQKQVTIHRIMHEQSIDSQTEAVVSLLGERLTDGGCAAVIVNTVSRAQHFAQSIRDAFPEKRVILIHASFVMPDRLHRENELLKQLGKKSEKEDRDGLILVGTQVIEQSLDYDVDFMISDLCPIDLLLQRIGRLHRHNVHDVIRPAMLSLPECHVLCAGSELDGGAKAIYGEYLLIRTSSLLPQTIIIPSDISALVQCVYGDAPLAEIPPGYIQAEELYRKEMKDRQKNARAFMIHMPNKREPYSQILQGDIPPDDAHATAQVRDGDPSIEASLLWKDTQGMLRLLPWLDENSCYNEHECPSPEDCRKILSHKIRIPVTLTKAIFRHEQLDALKAPETWRQSPWLRNENLLVLDNKLQRTIAGWRLEYNQQKGLQYKREEL